MSKTRRMPAGRIGNFHSSIPYFMFMVHGHAKGYAPANHFLAQRADDYEAAFQTMWLAFRLRARYAARHDDRLLPSGDPHGGTSTPQLRYLLANQGLAKVALTIQQGDKVSRLERTYIAFSSRRGPPAEGEKKGAILPLPQDWVGTTDHPVHGGKGKRQACTENRLLHGLEDTYPDASFSGTIRMYTDRIPCASCRAVIASFLRKHGGVELSVFYAYADAGEQLARRELSAARANIYHVQRLICPSRLPRLSRKLPAPFQAASMLVSLLAGAAGLAVALLAGARPAAPARSGRDTKR